MTQREYPVPDWVIIYAIRYGLGRSSYAFDDGLALADRYWWLLDDATRRDVTAARAEGR